MYRLLSERMVRHNSGAGHLLRDHLLYDQHFRVAILVLAWGALLVTLYFLSR